jgi:hypothetical protein
MLPKPDHIFSITPSDSATIPQTQYLMVTSGGDVSVETTKGTQGVLPGLVPGVQYAIAAVKVRATGTTASGIVGLA